MCSISRNFLKYEAFEDRRQAGDYRVEAIDTAGDGEVYVAIFAGPDAKDRAVEYAEWKNSTQHMQLAKAG